MQEKTFHEIEQEAWMKRGGEYDALFAPVSIQAIDPVLNSLGNLQGKQHLDVACGTGHLVAAAVDRGANSEGIDFARTMVDASQSNYPNLNFQMADAGSLPYPDVTFDIVTCAFGLSHMEHPDTAIGEAFRVLKPGGRFAFTLWYGPQDGNQVQAIIQQAVETYGTTPVVLPEAWMRLRNADKTICRALTGQAGFEPPTFHRLPIIWRLNSAEALIALVDKFSIRTKVLINRQPPEARRRIFETIRINTEGYRANGTITLASPAMLTIVQKPD